MFVELGQQLLLPLGELLWRLDQHLYVHVAVLARAQHRHSLRGETKPATRLRSFRNFNLGLPAINGRYVERTAERSRHHGDRDTAMQVGAIALEELVRRKREEDVEVTVRPAAHAGLTLASEANARAILDTRRHVHRERALARDAAGARAVRTWIVDHLAAALTGHAGALECEEALLVPHLSGAAAGRTGLGLGAGLRAGAGAHLTGDGRRNAHLRGLAAVSLLERDLHVVAQVGATLAATAIAAPAAHPEQVFEDIREGGAEIGAEARALSAPALLEGRMAEAVIRRAFLLILEDVVGLVDLLELRLAILAAWIAVRMPLHRQLAIGGLQFAVARGAGHFQQFVIIGLGHAFRGVRSKQPRPCAGRGCLSVQLIRSPSPFETACGLLRMRVMRDSEIKPISSCRRPPR